VQDGVAPRRYRHPLIARTGGKNLRETLAHLRPRRAIVLVRQTFSVDAHHLQETGIELRLDGPYRNKLAVAGRIAAVERRAAIDDVVGPPPRPAALLTKRLECRHQMRDTVDHGDVDRLSPARLTSLHRSREQTHHQIKRAAAEIGDQPISGRSRALMRYCALS